MSIRANISWESPNGHQLIIPAATATSSAVSIPEQDAEDIVYLFLDEAGNFDFSSNGSAFFIMTCVVVRRPFVLDKPLTSLKYDFIESGCPLEKFHACEDRNEVRGKVYHLINKRRSSMHAYAAIVDKRALPDEMKREDELYSRVFDQLTNEIFANETGPETKMVIITTDSLPKQTKRRRIEKPLKELMKRRFQANGIPYHLMHHQSCSSTYLQIADYLCWAVYRQHTQEHDWPMSRVESCFRAIGHISYTVDKERGDHDEGHL